MESKGTYKSVGVVKGRSMTTATMATATRFRQRYDAGEVPARVAHGGGANAIAWRVDPAALDARDRLVVLSTRKVGLDRPSEHEVPLGPLDLSNAARLFARQCPRLHTASDRRRFHALVTSADLQGAHSVILDALLGGLPGAIVAAAFRASREDLEG